MTLEQQTQIYLSAASVEEARNICAYTLGREAASEDIAAGSENLSQRCGNLVKIFGEMWTRGYTEYFTSWEILNKSAFDAAKQGIRNNGLL